MNTEIDVEELEAWMKAKGACHLAEITDRFACSRREAMISLGLLMAKDRIAPPWTSRNVPYVWWRTSSTPYAMAGKLRATSREEHPELWSVTKREKEAQLKRSQRLMDRAIEDSAMIAVLSEYPDGTTIEVLTERLGLARPTVMRRLNRLRSTGQVVQEGLARGPGRGRPSYLWGVPVGAGSSSPDTVEDDDDWRSVVKVLDE